MAKLTASTNHKLSERLQLLFDQLLPAQEVWDICCDHGYIGLRAHFIGDFADVHFVDSAAHLIAALQKKLRSQPGERLHFHPLAAQDLSQPLQGSVVIAGVGGDLILTIVKTLVSKQLLCAERLILSPHKDVSEMQESLCQDLVFSHQFLLTKTLSVREKNRERSVFVYDTKKNDKGPM